LVVYHWGFLNRNASQVRSSFRIDPSLKARLALVATTNQAGEIENFFLSRVQGRTNPAYRIPENLSLQARGILDLTRNSRWFVVVSAYDYAALARHEPRLIWRVKMSMERTGQAMAEALPALLRAGGPSFGRNMETAQILPVPWVSADADEAGTRMAAQFPPSPEVAGPVDRTYVRSLIQKERTEFSWIRAAQTKTDDDEPPH
jgi:hypothetical protein